jgi:signal transduction histidine kinase
MTQLAIQSGTVAFAPRARLLRLIGAELISDEVVAVTELVKNAHDADASLVTIQFVSVSSQDGAGEIWIRDDGTGIDLDGLLTRWMQPAGSGKGPRGTKCTPSGRRMLGEKGVGRFAADKLGARLELVSRRPGDTRELRAVFNWDEFEEDGRMLADVHSHWELRPADWLDRSGTLLRMTGLRTTWNEKMFRRLSTRLARLISPVQAPRGFKISVESDEFPEYAGDVNAGYLDDAPYRIEAEYDGERFVTCRLNGGKQIKRQFAGSDTLRCGPVRARIYAFDLETEALAQIGPRAEVRAWLREWSGISVYRDGFRVWPYGEPHDDWLRLDQRRVNNPVVKLSNNQIVGFIEISADGNPELRDQTNREGLIHNDALADLQRFVLDVLTLLEAERQSLRHPDSRRHEPRDPPAATREVDAVADALERIANQMSSDSSAGIQKMADRVRAAAAAEIEGRRRLLSGYSELAAAGHSAAIIGKSLSASLASLHTLCGMIREAVRTGSFDGALRAVVAVEATEAVISAASEQLTAVAQGGPMGARRRRGLDVRAELERLKGILAPALEAVDATLEVKATEGGVLRTEMRPETFAAIVSALVQNALDWAHDRRALRITVGVRSTPEAIEITFSDNGKGVTAGLEDRLFEPGVSGMPDAAGMGLTLVRNIVADHLGSVALISDRRRQGATFRILLPRKRSRATAVRA